MRPPLESGFDDPTLPSRPEGQRAPCPEAGNDGDALACPPSGGEQPKPAPPDDPVEWNAEKWRDVITKDPLKAISAANHLSIECAELKEDVANLSAQLAAKPAPTDDPVKWLEYITWRDGDSAPKQENVYVAYSVALTLAQRCREAEAKAAEQGRHAVSIFDECKKLQAQLAAMQLFQGAEKAEETTQAERWFYSLDEEHYEGDFATREEAIAEGREAYPGDTIYVGKGTPPIQPEAAWDADDWLDCVSNLDDYCLDCADDWNRATKEQRDELEALVRPILAAWLDRHGLRPTFVLINKPEAIEPLEPNEEDQA